MPKHILLETKPSEKPLLLLIDTNSGDNNQILNALVDKFYMQVETYVLSKKHISQNASKISPLGIHLLDKIREKISYAVLFLDSEKEKAQVLSAIDKLKPHNTRVLLLVPARSKGAFIDVLLDVKSNPNVVTLFIGDVFGNAFKQSKLSKTIFQSLRFQEITVAGTGLIPIYPISDTDLTDAAMHVLLGIKTPASFYNVYYRDPQTVLSLAHHLKRHEPELSISFEDFDTTVYDFEKNERIFKERIGMSPEYIKPLLGFDKSISIMSFEKATDEVVKKSKVRKRLRKAHTFRYVNTIGSKVFIAFLLYVIVSLSLLVFSMAFFKFGMDSFLKGDTKSALKKLEISSALYDFSYPTAMLLKHTAGGVHTDYLLKYIYTYDAVQENLPSALLAFRNIYENGAVNKDTISELQRVLYDLYFLAHRYNLPELNDLRNSPDFKESALFLSLFPVVSQIAGYEGEKSYVLLLQNSNELRPTGGFIGSVGYVTLENGKIKSLLIEDVYDLDGQLKGHVEPHYIIRRNLQPSLYLRDSNFNPDFDVTASTSAFLYNTESKRRIDGIISIDTQVLKKVIEVIGPISLEGQSISLSSENAVSMLQDSIHDDYFEGSTEKKQLLSELVKRLLVVLESDSEKRMMLIGSIPELIQSKHILFSFPSKTQQQVFVSNGFAGSLKDMRLPVYDIPDYLSINEANISVNKVNEFVSRKVTYSALLDQKTVKSDAFLEISNKGDEDYRSYIRFIVPANAQLTDVEIDGQTQQLVSAVTNPILFERQAFVSPAGLEVDSELQDNHKMIGFTVLVAANSTSRIHVRYATQYDVSEGNLAYSLLYIKQPGTLPYPLTISLDSNGAYSHGKNASGVIFNEEISKDTEVIADLKRMR
ncbi:MAG: DUF4012 domain-containing protein [Candidatus Levybacteria bacterium]|nr:DUF4012 domain-containing protein [Candidatus Levybacteria bacterium]